MYADIRRDGMGSLIDHLLQTASRRPELLRDLDVREADADDLLAWAEEELLIVEDEGQARFSVLLAEAMVEMSENVHSADDRVLGGNLTRETAQMYVRIAGSLRKAERLTGIARSTLHRAIHQEAA